MTMGQMRDIPLGCSIYTSDGDKLGTVKEVAEGAFKVNAHMQPDYWLPVDAVTTSAAERVTVSFDKDHLGDFKAGNPTDLRSRMPMGSTAGTSNLTSSGSVVGTSAPTGGTATRTETFTPAGTGPTPTGLGAGGMSAIGVPGGRSWDVAMPEYRQSWQSRYGSSGGRWEDAEPGYRYGYEMANDPRYSGRQWNDVQSDLGRDYPTWSQNQGYPTMMDGWTNAQKSVQEAWERTRSGSGNS